MELYFRGNQMPLGKGVIRQIGGDRKGSIDYNGDSKKGIFILDGDDYVLYRSSFDRSTKQWQVRDAREEIVGWLSREKEFTNSYFGYDAGHRGYYRILKDAGGYRIEGTNGEAAFVDVKKHWMRSGEHWLQTEEGVEVKVNEYEWVAVMQSIEWFNQNPMWLTAASGMLPFIVGGGR
ncbi:hypothetical protein [Saccharibacillus sp. JS10]|uniref:hypothetical protein n=1 Tax=Saccharibacillus sp. JS10 TaxID=2950552 RepID=UPI00210A1522|nr:hypothetical protein [Saccharibacillus sp. JS10]MCQ4086468.1 hypothetical protein [Saccharibacillus sp. JS10]